MFAPHIYIGVILRAHPIRGESHIHRNVNGEVATLSYQDVSLKKRETAPEFTVLQKKTIWIAETSNERKIVGCLLSSHPC